MVTIEETASSETFYDEKRDVIVIDEKLREYPEALKMALIHELEHARIENTHENTFRKFFEHAKHELKYDFSYAFSTKEKFIQFRSYLSDGQPDRIEAILLSLIRSLWTFPLYTIMSLRIDAEN